MQLLQGSKLIEVDMADPTDRALFTGAQKVMGVALTFFQVLAYLLGGAFGDFSTVENGTSVQIIIFLNLNSSYCSLF